MKEDMEVYKKMVEDGWMEDGRVGKIMKWNRERVGQGWAADRREERVRKKGKKVVVVEGRNVGVSKKENEQKHKLLKIIQCHKQGYVTD